MYQFPPESLARSLASTSLSQIAARKLKQKLATLPREGTALCVASASVRRQVLLAHRRRDGVKMEGRTCHPFVQSRPCTIHIAPPCASLRDHVFRASHTNCVVFARSDTVNGTRSGMHLVDVVDASYLRLHAHVCMHVYVCVRARIYTPPRHVVLSY